MSNQQITRGITSVSFQRGVLIIQFSAEGLQPDCNQFSGWTDNDYSPTDCSKSTASSHQL